MNRPSRIRNTISILAIAAVLSGCATGQQSRGSGIASKLDRENVGLATRAQVALSSQQYALAVELAERAVEHTPNDAGFRALLGNCYFGAGRFASAEAAYSDSLSLNAAQPQVILKLALVKIAQGKNAEALAALDSASPMLDPADYGLAVALAGQPQAAVSVLDHVARMSGADGRVRQNLALAYGLAGDWTMARTIASQDVPPDQIDARIQQWMAMAVPTRPSDQIAALTGIQPSADPGQPVRLALNSASQPQAYAEAAVPQPQPEAQPLAAPLPVVSAPEPFRPDPMPEPMAPVAVAESAPQKPSAFAQAAQTLLEPAPEPSAEIAKVEQNEVSEPSGEKTEILHAVAPKPAQDLPTRFEAAPTPASFVAITDKVRAAARKDRMSRSVVQLGAYSSPERVSVAWNRLTKKYPALANYTPVRARFASSKGTVWRLSIQGFESQGEAVQRCQALKGRGGSCFVRRVAGDSPVQFASR